MTTATVEQGSPSAAAPAPQGQPRRTKLRLGVLAVAGPGLIVMLADGDAGCLITAAQSGAQWGYRLILPQLLLIPLLYFVQEITSAWASSPARDTERSSRSSSARAGLQSRPHR